MLARLAFVLIMVWPAVLDATQPTQPSGPMVNVKDLGAKGDGRTDDYEAIQKAAAQINRAGSGTLVFPPGRYLLNRISITKGPAPNGNKPITFSRCNGLRIQGQGAVIEVKGDFHRGKDVLVNGKPVSYSSSIIPFDMDRCSNFSIEGFELVGGAQRMTKDPEVLEGSCHGIRTSGCSDYTLRDLTIHHFATDGVYLGGGNIADRGAMVERVKCARNGRQGMSLIHIQNATILDSTFEDTGRTEGAYGGHAPQAGVDIEPNAAPPKVDVATGQITFKRCTFRNNLGHQFVAAKALPYGPVRIESSVLTRAADSLPIALYLVVSEGVVTGCQVDGEVQPTRKHKTGTRTVLEATTIRARDNGILSLQDEALDIIGCTLILTRPAPSAEPFPKIRNARARLLNTRIIIPAAALDTTAFAFRSTGHSELLAGEMRGLSFELRGTPPKTTTKWEIKYTHPPTLAEVTYSPKEFFKSTN